MLPVVCLLAILAIDETNGGYGHFEGGAISFSVRKDNKTDKLFADLDILTGWVFQRGPCGRSCKISDINMPTDRRRLTTTTAVGDALYFGNWTAEFKVGGMKRMKDITTIINTNMKETVFALDTQTHWEQELMKVSLELDPASTGYYEDVSFEGESWHQLNMQPANVSWHMQAKMDRRVRNDTGVPNRSPIVYIRPLYRIKLNEVNTIHIAATDADGDLVKCKISQYSESGSISQHPLPGLSIKENCTVTINADAAKYGYHDDAWGVVAITVRDYNREIVELDGRQVAPHSHSLSGTAAQFLVQVVGDLSGPVFVSPTPMASQHFTLYQGSSWRALIFAKANENTTISKFIATGREKEVVSVSPIKDGHDSKVRFVEVQWKPNAIETGNHIICVTAIDDSGIQSLDDRCFTIEITPVHFKDSSSPEMDCPYFVDMPANGQLVECATNVTCVLPLYIKSDVGVERLTMHRKFEVTETGPITLMTINGTRVYQSDLSFSHSSAGQQIVCLIAAGTKGELSDAMCIQAKFVPPDPCLSNHCFNSGTCLRSEQDPNAYTCHCRQHTHGKNCEIKDSLCSLYNPCTHGHCYDYYPNDYYCDCSSTGYEGRNCSRPSSNCQKENCIHGLCQTLILSSHCVCDPGYVGQRCDTSSP